MEQPEHSEVVLPPPGTPFPIPTEWDRWSTAEKLDYLGVLVDEISRRMSALNEDRYQQQLEGSG